MVASSLGIHTPRARTKLVCSIKSAARSNKASRGSPQIHCRGWKHRHGCFDVTGLCPVYGWRVPRSRGPWCRTDGEWIPARNQALFTIGVIAALSNVQVMSPTGAMIAASKPVNDPSDQQIVIVRLKHALPPGTYKVSWRAVSIHERPTSGTFRFTVA